MEKKLKMFLLLVFMSVSIYSQTNYPKVVLVGKDTTVVFSQEQVKKMAIDKVRLSMYKEMSDSCYSNALIMEQKIIVQQKIIDNYSMQVSKYDTLISNFQKIDAVYEKQIDQKDKEIKSMKRERWIYAGVTVVVIIISLLK